MRWCREHDCGLNRHLLHRKDGRHVDALEGFYAGRESFICDASLPRSLRLLGARYNLFHPLDVPNADVTRYDDTNRISSSGRVSSQRNPCMRTTFVRGPPSIHPTARQKEDILFVRVQARVVSQEEEATSRSTKRFVPVVSR